MTSEWPFMYLVIEFIDMSAPRFNASQTALISLTFNSGFVGVSNQISFVLFLIELVTSSTF
ncbi:hypothetical protein DERP_008040 [Dermatophagoides pteronyssinus]|uniref:Uncharacterized protein n=1 Tax=Dermatophagoides pteronyssinus TaxID=6956 RepID=A0ABQ8JK04_DERPT|nr:hypothetical protein DERP_008040 [Dermatophagoides pteronyssinus]